MVQHVDSVAGEGLGWLSHRGRRAARRSAVDGSVSLKVAWGAGPCNTRVEVGGGGGGGGGVGGLAWGDRDCGKGTARRC